MGALGSLFAIGSRVYSSRLGFLVLGAMAAAQLHRELSAVALHDAREEQREQLDELRAQLDAAEHALEELHAADDRPHVRVVDDGAAGASA